MKVKETNKVAKYSTLKIRRNVRMKEKDKKEDRTGKDEG